MLVFALIVLGLADISGEGYATCTTPYELKTFPFSEKFIVDEKQKFPGDCGEDSTDQSNVWLKLVNTNTEPIVYNIVTDASLAFHNSCDSECIDTLPSTTTLTVPATATFLLVLKSNETVQFAINALEKSDATSPILIPQFPFNGVYQTAKTGTKCFPTSLGAVFSLPDFGKYSAQLNTYGSSVSLVAYYEDESKCYKPLQTLTDGVLYLDMKNEYYYITNKFQLISIEEEPYEYGVIAVNFEYKEGPVCTNAVDLVATSDGANVTGIIYSGTLKGKDACSTQEMAFEYVRLIGGDCKVTITTGKKTPIEVHLFDTCDMKECVKSYSTDETTLTFDVAFDDQIYVKIATSSEENLSFNINAENNSKLSTGMIVFIVIFVIIALLVIVAGIVAVVLAVIRQKKSTYSSL
uniref:Transmembrane protein n=1 Tax=Entamoeba invadens TaxID=33085 RepID=S0B0C1_ENTIV|nr:hypothetical protein [Entamoeba invadens]